MEKEKNIFRYEKIKKELYEMQEKQNNIEENKNYYEKSIYALVEYMKNNEKNPSEKSWDEIAICNKYLSSKTIGYLSGRGFNKLCRNLRKEINKDKRQIKK